MMKTIISRFALVAVIMLLSLAVVDAKKSDGKAQARVEQLSAKVNLTDDQKAQALEIYKADLVKSKEIAAKAEKGTDEYKTLDKARKKEVKEATDAILTPEQRELRKGSKEE